MYAECCSAHGRYVGVTEQISRHASPCSVSISLRCPLAVEQSPVSCLSVFVLLRGVSCLPNVGNLDTSDSGRDYFGGTSIHISLHKINLLDSIEILDFKRACDSG